ncbi:MAG: hypothetical protein JWN52_2270 [Actinomycetia bacterium]|nr:hypothetical protein [Actinomycetes bacterium]
MPEGSWAGGFRPLLANRYRHGIITETALATTDATSGCTDAHAITWKDPERLRGVAGPGPYGHAVHLPMTSATAKPVADLRGGRACGASATVATGRTEQDQRASSASQMRPLAGQFP